MAAALGWHFRRLRNNHSSFLGNFCEYCLLMISCYIIYQNMLSDAVWYQRWTRMGFWWLVVFENFVLGLRRSARKLFSCCWISVTAVIVQEIPGSPDFFWRTSNFNIAGVGPLFTTSSSFSGLSLFLEINIDCLFSNGRILQEQVSSRPHLSFRHEGCGAGYLARPPVARTSCGLCGRPTLPSRVYCFVIVGWLDGVFGSSDALLAGRGARLTVCYVRTD